MVIHSLYPRHSCIWKKATRLQSNLSSYIFFALCNTVHTFLSSPARNCHILPPLFITRPLRTSLLPLVAAKPKHFARDAPCLLHSEGGLGSPPRVGWLAKQIVGSGLFFQIESLKTETVNSALVQIFFIPNWNHHRWVWIPQGLGGIRRIDPVIFFVCLF